MDLTNNTILITGGGSGIGRWLAEALHALGNQVIIAGRRQKNLEEVTAANPGMQYRVLNQDDAADVKRFAAELVRDFPKLNVLLNNAGIQRMEDLTLGDVSEAEATITTNLLGPIRLIGALVPHLIGQSRATIINVSSTLACVPAAPIPTYCATKAAMHSYTQSLRLQLRKSGVQVIEILPPWVQTELQGDRGMNPKAMPLADYIAETIGFLKNPDVTEIISERGKAMRYAERNGTYDEFFEKFNEGWLALQAK